jgi:nitroreductase
VAIISGSTPEGTSAGAAAGSAGDALRVLLAGRRSCRAYAETPVPRNTIAELLRRAQLAPSWCNTQPWRVIVTCGSGTERFRAALSGHAASHAPAPDIPFPSRYEGEYADRRQESAQQLYESVGAVDRHAVRRQAAENFRFFGAPHVAIVTTSEPLGTYGAVDCGLYLMAFMLVAHSLGVSCVAQASIAGYSDFVRSFFDLPQGRHVVCGVSFGYPEERHPVNAFRTRRAGLDDVVTWCDV